MFYNYPYKVNIDVDMMEIVAQMSIEGFVEFVKEAEKGFAAWDTTDALYKHFRDLREEMTAEAFEYDEEGITSPEFDDRYLLEDQLYDKEMFS